MRSCQGGSTLSKRQWLCAKTSWDLLPDRWAVLAVLKIISVLPGHWHMMQTVMHTQTLSTANAWQQRSHACQRLRCHLQQQHTISHSRCSSTVVKASEAAATAARSPVVASRFGDLSWASCVSSKTTVTSAVQDAVDSIMQHQQGDFQPDLALVFASCNYGSQLQDVVRAIRRAVPSVRKVFGCSVRLTPS